MLYKRDEEYALKVIDKAIYGTLSMVDLEGKPYGVPISFARVENYIYFHGAINGKKINILKNNGSVSLSCVNKMAVDSRKFTTDYSAAIVEGVIEFIDDEKEKIKGLKALSLKYSSEDMDRFDEVISRSIKRTLVFKMRIENIYGKGKLNE